MSIFLASGNFKGLESCAVVTEKKLGTKKTSGLTAESVIYE